MARVARFGEKYDFEELCPNCDEWIEIKYDRPAKRDFKYEIICPCCGEKMMLCTMCHDDYGDICDWNEENGCRISRGEFPGKRIWEDDRDVVSGTHGLHVFSDLPENIYEAGFICKHNWKNSEENV